MGHFQSPERERGRWESCHGGAWEISATVRTELIRSSDNLILHCTELENGTCTWLQECCKQVEAEVVSNSKNILHRNHLQVLFSGPVDCLLVGFSLRRFVMDPSWWLLNQIGTVSQDP